MEQSVACQEYAYKCNQFEITIRFFFEIHATNQYANTIFWILIETAIYCGEFCNDTKPNSIELSLYSYTFKEVDDG